MNATELERKLIDWTARNSGYDEHRPYIGLSGIYDCPTVIYRKYFNRIGASAFSKCKTKFSYEIEKNLIDRLKAMGLYSRGEDISLYDGLVQGHIEGLIDGTLFDIKTVPRDIYLPNGRIPSRVEWQLNAYLLYRYEERALVWYFSRESGLFKILDIFADECTMKYVQEKVNMLVDAVTTQKEPKCQCGRCG